MNFNLKLPLSNTLTFLIVPYAHHEPRGVTPGALVRCMPTPSPHISRQRFDVLTGCGICLSSSFSVPCTGCSWQRLASGQGCELTCQVCTDSQGASGQPQPLSIPVDGCLVETNGTQLTCRPESEGTCGHQIPIADSTQPSADPGCQICPDSDFFGSCSDCVVDDCLLTCQSCQNSQMYGKAWSYGSPLPLSIPPGGCFVQNNWTSALHCSPYSEGGCPLGTHDADVQQQESISAATWKAGAVGISSVVGFVLVIKLAVLFMQRRRLKQPSHTKRESACSLMDTTQLSGSVPTKFFSPVLQQQTWLQRWRSSVLSTLRLFDFWRACSGYKSVTSSELELTPGHERSSPQKLVQAITISPDKVEVCKTEQGKDWLLGMGSYGMVYKAKMGELDVAVKTIKREHYIPEISCEKALKVMQQELRILEALPFDRNVVQLHGSYTQGDSIMLVLEYMQGGDLRQALNGPYEPALSWYRQGAHVALDIIKGLHFLHSHGVLHRDVKSGNVLLSEGFASAKICDVGLARVMGNTPVPSSSHNARGTFDYAAPEMLLCLRCDERSDIFSYGVVLWELITQQHAQRGRLRDFEVPEECPAAVSDMVNACLSEQAAARPTAQHIFQVIQTSILEMASRTAV